MARPQIRSRIRPRGRFRMPPRVTARVASCGQTVARFAAGASIPCASVPSAANRVGLHGRCHAGHAAGVISHGFERDVRFGAATCGSSDENAQ